MLFDGEHHSFIQVPKILRSIHWKKIRNFFLRGEYFFGDQFIICKIYKGNHVIKISPLPFHQSMEENRIQRAYHIQKKKYWSRSSRTS